MKTQYRLVVSLVLSCLISTLIVCIALFILLDVKIELERNRLYDKTLSKTNALSVLIAELKVSTSPSTLSQIYNVYGSLDNLLNLMSSDTPLEESCIQTLREGSKRLKFLLNQTLSSNSNQELILDKAKMGIIYTQLWMNVHRMSDEINRLRGLSQARIVVAQSNAGVSILFLLATLIISNTIIFFVSGRKIVQAEQLLHESEERNRLILKTASDGFWRTDLQAKLLEVNDAYCQMSGYTEQELLEMGVSDIEVAETPGENPNRLKKIVVQEKERFESKHRRKDGSIFDVEISVQKLHYKDGQRVFFLRDLTDKKLSEEANKKLQLQFAQAQKLESIGRLAGGVAHDFNNMLSVILGYTDLALKKLDSTQPLYDDLKEVHRAATRSADLTQQLLAFARRQIAEPKVLDLNLAIGEMLKLLRRLIGEDIKLAWLPGANLGLVKMDPSQVDQILANLCVNARDAITGVGKITIETFNTAFDEVYCDEHPGFIPGSYVMLAVSDDGCGMDKETAASIFEPFFSTKSPEKGTGLGLSTVYGIARQYNGFINVYSEPSQGTTFKIYLRRHEAETEAYQIKTDIHLTEGGSETILLVEDEEIILKLCKRMLENLGYKVLTAKIPNEAIKLSKGYSGSIDLLLTDVVMPNMNGMELSEQLKKGRSELEVLFMSGYTANVIAHHGILKDGLKFLPKPFSSEELAHKVRNALKKRNNV